MNLEPSPREMPPGTKVWIYLRISPGDNQTIESQEAEVLKVVKEKRWVVARTFRDQWASGKSREGRDAFEMMAHLVSSRQLGGAQLLIAQLRRPYVGSGQHPR
jgi:hypothetical protein